MVYSLTLRPKSFKILIICKVCSGSNSVRGALTIPDPNPNNSIAFLTGIGLTSQNIMSIKESRLSCILIELDDGNDKHFLSRLKNYPNYIINHINKDAEYVFEGLPHFLIFPDE